MSCLSICVQESSSTTSHTTDMVSAMYNIKSTLYKAVGLCKGCKILVSIGCVCSVSTVDDVPVMEEVEEEDFMNATDNM